MVKWESPQGWRLQLHTLRRASEKAFALVRKTIHHLLVVLLLSADGDRELQLSTACIKNDDDNKNLIQHVVSNTKQYTSCVEGTQSGATDLL